MIFASSSRPLSYLLRQRSPLIRKMTRNLAQTATGAILQKPNKVSLGVAKFFLLVIPCIYVGGMVSMKGASLLEDYDIFVPEDEDD